MNLTRRQLTGLPVSFGAYLMPDQSVQIIRMTDQQWRNDKNTNAPLGGRFLCGTTGLLSVDSPDGNLGVGDYVVNPDTGQCRLRVAQGQDFPFYERGRFAKGLTIDSSGHELLLEAGEWEEVDGKLTVLRDVGLSIVDGAVNLDSYQPREQYTELELAPVHFSVAHGLSTVSAPGGTNPTVSPNAPTGTDLGMLLFGAYGHNVSLTVSSPLWNGGAPDLSEADLGSNSRGFIWSIIDYDTGTHDAEYTLNAAPAGTAWVGAAFYEGVNQSDLVEDETEDSETGGGSNPATSAAINPTTAQSYLWSMFCGTSGGATVSSSSHTERAKANAVGRDVQVQDTNAGISSSTSMSVTMPGDENWIFFTLSLAPAAAAGGGVPPLPFQDLQSVRMGPKFMNF